MQRVAVIGAGGWGTALAALLAKKGCDVILWARRAELAEEISTSHTNETYLPGVTLPSSLKVSSDMEEAIYGREALVFAVPSQQIRAIGQQLARFLSVSGSLPVFVSASKGLEKGSLLRMSEVIRDEMPQGRECHVVSLSGPNHAEEVGREIPSASVVAYSDKDVAEAVQDLFMTPAFRVYTNPDQTGVEMGGALKNIIALAAGISDGLGFGDNTKAALMTRGIVEIARLGVAMGARPMTFGGLSGTGDLIATCTSKHSRNAWAGAQIGAGKPLKEVLGSTKMVVEGVFTTSAARELALARGVEMPITNIVYEVLFEGLNPMKGVAALMERGATVESEQKVWEINLD